MQRSRSRAGRLRTGLGVLAVVYTLLGGWALVAPASFYNDFPAPGMGWVAELPPFNEHLVTDVGAGFLAIAAMQVLAAVWLQRRLVQAALVATLVQAVPHLGFHLLHAGELPTAQLVASRVALAVPVGLAAGLLWWSSRRARTTSLGW